MFKYAVRFTSRGLTGSLWFLFAAQLVMAQLPSATISGVVKDETGSVIPGAKITATNVETGLTRSGITAGDGTYKFPVLPVGTYEIRAEQSGFRTEVQSGLKLSVGQGAVVNFLLQVGAVEQTVSVTAEVPMIETTTADVSGLVAENQVRELPLNARNLIELATLFPGVTVSRTGGSGGGVNNGFAMKLTISGTRFTSNLYQIDGQDIIDTAGGTGSAAGIMMGVETIREFNVVTSGYSAEYGKHTGGVFNAVTKSGTNSLHGSVFEFLRNEKMDARNFFDKEIPPYKRNQYGFAVGGPIRKDRTFFFGSYEALRERLGQTNIFNVPTPGARQGLLPNPTTGVVTVYNVVPVVQPWLDAYPLPNGRDFGNGTAEFIRPLSLPLTENFFTARADQSLSDNDSLFGRYTYDNAWKLGSVGMNYTTRSKTRVQYAALGETHLFSPNVINTLLLAFNRSYIAQFPDEIFPQPTRSFTLFDDPPDGPVGNISVPGLSTWGAGGTSPNHGSVNAFQVKDDIVYIRGLHTFKFGFNGLRRHYMTGLYFNGAGSFSFANLGDFMQGIANRFTGMLPHSSLPAYVRNILIGLYAQDDIRISPNLTLNLGLRYETVTSPRVENDRVSNLHHFLTPGQTRDDLVLGNPLYLNPSLKNFAPRVGLAWDPFGSGKTSIRAGAGIFHDQIDAGIFHFSFLSTPPFYENADIVSSKKPQFPDAFFVQRDLLAGNAQIETFQYNVNQPTIYKYNLSIQHAVTPSTSVEVKFSGTRGVHLMRPILSNMPIAEVRDGRLFIPSTAPRMHPAWGRLRPKMSDVTSDYHGFQLQVEQRLSRGLQFRASYTFSKAIDDGSNFGGSADFGNSAGGSRYIAMKDRGLSAFDIRNALTLNFSYDLPGSNLTGAVGKVIGGWQLSSILTVQSGPPFDVSSGAPPSWMRSNNVGDFPDVVAGASVQYDTRNPNAYFDPSAFKMPGAPDSAPGTANPGFIGNAGRAILIAPGIATLNVVLSKNTSLSENVNLQFRSEFYNLFNRANFEIPSGAIFDAQTRAFSPSVGRITGTSTQSRQLQFGLKLVF